MSGLHQLPEMVTDKERDYLWNFYAKDRRMRINLGIRRRLAPLMDNDRRKIELLNSLLFSMPGTPVVYYGDEIGMGDNVYLGDRNGVRTPMQWSADRNAGFSEANRQRLFLPVITDPEYSYEAVNVDAQQANPSSLLWWMKRLIALRKQYQAFGRGSLSFLTPENRRIVAFVREFNDERILVVANMSRFVQHAELDLAPWRGLVPVEMFGRVEFPRTEDRPLFLTLGPHSFIWFSLEADPSGRGHEVRPVEEKAPAISGPADLERLLAGGARALAGVLPGYVRARRWFRSKARRIKNITLRDALRVPFDGSADIQARLAIFDIDYTEGESESYVLPLALARSERVESSLAPTPQAVIATVLPDGEGGTAWTLYDAIYEPAFATALLDAVGGKRRVSGRRTEVTGSPTPALRRLRGRGAAALVTAVGRAEQSNTSVVFGDRLILKLFRRLEPGANPEIEIGQALTAARFRHVPALGGWLSINGRREPQALAVVQEFVANEGDAWEFTLDAVGGFYERAAASEGDMMLSGENLADLTGNYQGFAQLLGTRTAELHRVLAGHDDPAFAPEPFSALYQRSVFQNLRNQANGAIALLRRRLDDLPGEARPAAERAIKSSEDILRRVRELTQRRIGAVRIRTHGDYHLGQVLWTGKDVVIIDFEGEPGRPLSERRHRRSALADVAGMLRSFHYAAFGTLLNPRIGGAVRPEDIARLEPWAAAWYSTVSGAFVDAYLESAAGQPFVPRVRAEQVALLELAMLQKVLYELNYELNNRPDWVSIPLRGLLDLLGTEGADPVPDESAAPDG